jgi:hypothetical protein
VLRRIFGPKGEEVTGSWKRQHNEAFRNLYALLNIVSLIKSRRMEFAGHEARMEEMRNAYKILIGESEVKRARRRPRRKREYDIKMDLRKMGHEGVDWVHLAQDKVQ